MRRVCVLEWERKKLVALIGILAKLFLCSERLPCSLQLSEGVHGWNC